MSRRERILRTLAEHLATEMGQDPDQVYRELQEAVSAGLLRVTRRGVEATIPEQAT